MTTSLVGPKWLLAHSSVLIVVVVFVSLGVWQLNRLEERRDLNDLIEIRSEISPVALGTVDLGDISDMEFRRVTVVGAFDPQHEVLIRSQVRLGVAGFHVITPFQTEMGDVVLVNRGWIPLGVNQVPVEDAPPPDGATRIQGWIHQSQNRPAFGPVEPEGVIDVLNRVDIDRVQSQVPYSLADFYLVEIGDQDVVSLPIPLSPPVFDDEGSHFSYAFQWFGFAVITIVGYVALVRKRRPRIQSEG